MLKPRQALYAAERSVRKPSPCFRCSPRRSHTKTTTTKAASPHPALTVLPDFLDADEQSVLLRHSLRLLDAPARTTAAGRKKRREWVRSNATWDREFLADEAYDWQEAHFDSVIKQYRETLVRPGMWDPPAEAAPLPDANELAAALRKIYSLLPPPERGSAASAANSNTSSVADDAAATTAAATTAPEEAPSSPPSHLILHLLHLSSKGAIYPHVDNLEAFGRTIVGISLGGERVMRFKRVDAADSNARDDSAGPADFDVLLSPGSAYIQK